MEHNVCRRFKRFYRSGETLIDIIGNLNSDEKFGENKTLIRKPSVTGPYVSDSTGWNADEWTEKGKDDVSNLGTHTMN